MSEPHIISCATVAEELRRLGVGEERLTVLEFGLHVYPEELKKRLQCSYAVVGLKSETHRLVIPLIDDCIALFLGSRAEHKRLQAEEPGTYFLTKGWVEAQEGALVEYVRIRERYGEERAIKVARLMYGNYTRIALIDTGNYRMDDCRRFGRGMAEFLGLRFDELAGSNRMLLKMLEGDWDEEFLIVEAGHPVLLEPFTAIE
jgi:hypothetical protein